MHQNNQPDFPPRPSLRELELEVAHKLFDALRMRLERVLARPFEKERLHHLAKLVQVASRLARNPD